MLQFRYLQMCMYGGSAVPGGGGGGGHLVTVPRVWWGTVFLGLGKDKGGGAGGRWAPAVLPSNSPFCAYSICVDEVAVEGDIVPSLVGGASPVLYGDFAWSMQVFLKFKVKVICLPFAGNWRLVPFTGRRYEPFGSLSPCIVRYSAEYPF